MFGSIVGGRIRMCQGGLSGLVCLYMDLVQYACTTPGMDITEENQPRHGAGLACVRKGCRDMHEA